MHKCSKILRLSAILIPIFFLCFSTTLPGQDSLVEYKAQFIRKQLLDLSFDTYVPMQFYRRQMDDSGFGGSAGHFVQIVSEAPLFLGYFLGFRQFQLRSVAFKEIINMQTVDFKEKLGLNYFQINGSFRYYLPLPWYMVQFFIQGDAGYLATYSVYRVLDVAIRESTEWEIDNWDGAIMYQLTGGLNIPLSEVVYIRTELAYLYSNSHTFLASDISKKKTLKLVRDYYTEKKAPFEALNIKIGVTFVL